MLSTVKVFVSSTFVGMEQFRAAVLGILHGIDFIKPAGMEYFGAANAPSIEKCLQEIRTCDVFIAVLGPRYGSFVLGTDKSYSEAEWDEALRLKKPTYLFCSTALNQSGEIPIEPDAVRLKQEQFRARASTVRQAAYFSTPDELAKQVLLAIFNLYSQKFLSQSSSPERGKSGSDTEGMAVPVSDFRPAYLSFPYVTAAAGIDTGIVILNTSQEPFGKGIGGAARVFFSTRGYLPKETRDRDPQGQGFSIGTLYPGDYKAFLLSTGGVGNLCSAAGYTGQLWVQCFFRPCAGMAFLTNPGDTRWGSIYRADVIEP